MKKYYDKISLWSRLVNSIFIFTNAKKNSSTVEGAKQFVQQLEEKNKKYCLPEKLKLKKEIIDDMEVYCYNGDLTNNKKKLFYIHGGSYIEEASYFQLKFAMKIADKTDSTLVFPRYPLAPEGNYRNMYDLMEKLYQKLLETNSEINFLGDSAGGGFILSFAMYLRDRKINQPKNIIMMSPWLDISLSNPKIYDDAKKDKMCGVDGTRYCGKLWAAGLDTKNPLVSPIYGEFNNLSKMTIIVGEKEIFKTECINFSDKLNENSISHNMIMYKGQGHDFGAYPTKEGKMVIKDICDIINN